MAASCPPISGAICTSVVRTTPTIGAKRSWRNTKYAAAIPKSAMTARIAKRRRRTLVMGVLRSKQPRRQRGEHEIHGGHNPQAAPIRPDLRKVGSHLVE